MTHLKIGKMVRFTDSTATTTKDEVVVAEGIVNGEPITDGLGAVTHVPVFAKRDNGRESTTIYVHVSNLMERGAA